MAKLPWVEKPMVMVLTGNQIGPRISCCHEAVNWFGDEGTVWQPEGRSSMGLGRYVNLGQHAL